MKDFIYNVSELGYLTRNGKCVKCPFDVDIENCGSWCALFDVFLGEHTMIDKATGTPKKNPNFYIRLNCSHAVYTVKGE